MLLVSFHGKIVVVGSVMEKWCHMATLMGKESHEDGIFGKLSSSMSLSRTFSTCVYLYPSRCDKSGVATIASNTRTTLGGTKLKGSPKYESSARSGFVLYVSD